MPEVRINGARVSVEAGTSVAAAVLGTGVSAFRHSVTGQPRGPVCGMGICYECCLTVDGDPHARSCQIVCRDGMVIQTS